MDSKQKDKHDKADKDKPDKKPEPIGYLYGYPVYVTDKVPSLGQTAPVTMADPFPASTEGLKAEVYKAFGLSPPTVGEHLAEIATALLIPARRKFYATGAWTDTQLAYVKLAMDFWRQGPAFVFRAIVEGWDQQRIVREIY